MSAFTHICPACGPMLAEERHRHCHECGAPLVPPTGCHAATFKAKTLSIAGAAITRMWGVPWVNVLGSSLTPPPPLPIAPVQ